jgi:hypothetical protein
MIAGPGDETSDNGSGLPDAQAAATSPALLVSQAVAPAQCMFVCSAMPSLLSPAFHAQWAGPAHMRGSRRFQNERTLCHPPPPCARSQTWGAALSRTTNGRQPCAFPRRLPEEADHRALEDPGCEDVSPSASKNGTDGWQPVGRTARMSRASTKHAAITTRRFMGPWGSTGHRYYAMMCAQIGVVCRRCWRSVRDRVLRVFS